MRNNHSVWKVTKARLHVRLVLHNNPFIFTASSPCHSCSKCRTRAISRVLLFHIIPLKCLDWLHSTVAVVREHCTSNTSSPTRNMGLALRCSTNATSSTTGPRLAFTRTASCFTQILNKISPIIYHNMHPFASLNDCSEATA